MSRLFFANAQAPLIEVLISFEQQDDLSVLGGPDRSPTARMRRAPPVQIIIRSSLCARCANTGDRRVTRPFYTGHFSSFHAMSQNIHSYRELMMKESSIRWSASLPAVLAH